MADKGVLIYMFLRRPGICGPDGMVVASERTDSDVFGRLSFLKKRERFLRADLRSARSSERMDSAMVDAAVRTVRRRRSGSMGASLSSSSWSCCGWRLKSDIGGWCGLGASPGGVWKRHAARRCRCVSTTETRTANTALSCGFADGYSTSTEQTVPFIGRCQSTPMRQLVFCHLCSSLHTVPGETTLCTPQLKDPSTTRSESAVVTCHCRPSWSTLPSPSLRQLCLTPQATRVLRANHGPPVDGWER